MEFITHHRFRGLALYGERVNIPYGTELQAANDFLFTRDGKAVCCCISEIAKRHFAQNDDGRGLERGKLTYAIAYRGRQAEGGFRFSEKEIEILKDEWGRFLRKNVDAILFNDKFFSAEPDELQKLADALNIKVK